MTSLAGGLFRPKPKGNPKLANALYDSGTGRMIQMRDRVFVAPEIGPDSKIPEGFAVVVIGYGMAGHEMAPVRVTVDDWSIVIPRNSKRAIPLQHLNLLSQCIQVEFTQRQFGQPLEAHPSKRFPVQVLHWPKEAGDIMKSEIEYAHEQAERIDIGIG